MLTAEKKLKMSDTPLSEIKDDTRLRQHEKEILLQEVYWSPPDNGTTSRSAYRHILRLLDRVIYLTQAFIFTRTYTVYGD